MGALHVNYCDWYRWTPEQRKRFMEKNGWTDGDLIITDKCFKNFGKPCKVCARREPAC